MSADNWSVCPRCLRLAEEAQAAAQAKAKPPESTAIWVRQVDGQASWAMPRDDGAIPPDEDWTVIEEPEPLHLHDFMTFREDYAIGIRVPTNLLPGVSRPVPMFAVEYRGECTECGLLVEHAAEQPVDA